MESDRGEASTSGMDTDNPDRPEDILGSVEVDRTGTLLDNFQSSGTYRILTNEGMYASHSDASRNPPMGS